MSLLHQSTAASTWWCGPRPRLGWVEMAVGLPEGPSYPRHSPFIFSLCCPLNDRRRAAHTIFKIGRQFSLFLLSCLTLALLRLFILLLLLMSGNVHPNPGWKCDLAGQVSAMLRLLQMGSSKVLQKVLQMGPSKGKLDPFGAMPRLLQMGPTFFI